MSKSSAIESTLAKLAALKLAPRSPEAAKELKSGLANKVDYVVERAAEFIREFKLADFAPELSRAFLRIVSAGGDSVFGARTAIATALYEMKANTPEVYLAGVRMFGSPPPGGEDPAAPLRGICAMGLVRIGHRLAMIEAVDLLADAHGAARIGAIRAMAYSCTDAAGAVLRFKLHQGDRQSEVIGECLSALMQLDAGNSLPLVSRYLQEADELIADSAALALGESRKPEAFQILREHFERSLEPEAHRSILLAIAITRLPDAPAFLVSKLVDTDLRTARYAMDALKMYRLDEVIRRAIEQAVEKRGDAALRAYLRKVFD